MKRTKSDRLRLAEARTARRATGISPHGTNWDLFANRSDEEIEAGIAADPDAAPTDDAFWSRAVIVRHPHERAVSVVLDADIAQWFRNQKNGSSRVNAFLRERMEAERRPPAKKRKVGR